MTDANEKVAKGYTTKTIIDRIADMDMDAGGNAEKAAWKRYLSYALLGMAKGIDKKALIEGVFGKGGKPSKNFQNMYSMAGKCRHTVLGNAGWDDVRPLGIDDALEATLGFINRHMATLDVTSKNAYDAVCHLSPAEAAAAKEAEAAAKAEATAEAEAKAKVDAEAKAKAEEEAKDRADAATPKTPSEIAIGALHGASLDDMMAVLIHIVDRVDAGTLKMIHRDLGAMIANRGAAEDVIDATAEDITPKGDVLQIAAA